MHCLLGRKRPVVIERVFKHGTETLLDLQGSVDEINKFFAEIGDSTATHADYGPRPPLVFSQLDPPNHVLLINFSRFTEVGLLEMSLVHINRAELKACLPQFFLM